MSRMSPEEEEAVQAELEALQREALVSHSCFPERPEPDITQPAIPAVPSQQPVRLPDAPLEEPVEAPEEPVVEDIAGKRVATASQPERVAMEA